MKMTFGEFLSARRKEKGLTQKELAQKLFITESAVSKWEQGRANPDISILPTLCELLEVSEHELITASIDSQQRENNVKAKKWNRLSFGWNLFFYLAYGITLLTCFICNLAVSGTLSWFWIVLCSLLLPATFTTLPNFVKKGKLFVLTLSPLMALILLLGVCCLSTDGNWFFVAAFPVIVAFLMVFLPIYLKSNRSFSFLKKHSGLLSIAFCTVMTVLMMYVIESFTLKNGYVEMKWATSVAMPFLCMGALIAFVFIVVIRYLPLRASFKASALLGGLALAHYPLLFWVDDRLYRLFGSEKQQIHLPNLTKWTDDVINDNVQFLIAATMALCAIAFLCVGIFKHTKKSK